MKKILFFVFILLAIFLLRGGAKQSLYKFSSLELDRQATRQKYYGELGKFYRNRVGFFYMNSVYPALIKAETVFFQTIDTGFVFLPLYGVIFYMGFKKNEK